MIANKSMHRSTTPHTLLRNCLLLAGTAVALLLLVGTSSFASSFQSALDASGSGKRWVHFEFQPFREGTHACVYRDGGHTWRSNHGVNNDPSDDAPLRISIKLDGSRVIEIEAMTPECSNIGRRNSQALTGVTPSSAARWFERLYENRKTSKDLRGSALFVYAHLPLPGLSDQIEKWMQQDDPRADDGELLFALGQGRGEEALPALRRWVDLDGLFPVRRSASEAMFALTLIKNSEADELMIACARRHPDSEVRSQALFWIAQRAQEFAIPELLHAAEKDPMSEVREGAVFGISQLPSEKAVPLLIKLAETHSDPVVKKSAYFWLSQQGDSKEAQDYLIGILER